MLNNSIDNKGGMVVKKMYMIPLVISMSITVLYGCNSHKAISNVGGSSKPIVSNKTAEKDNIAAVHYGIALNIVDGNIDIFDTANSQQKQRILKKYEKEYYLYSNNKFIAKAAGKVEGSGLDSYWKVVFPSNTNKYEVAISESFSPYPRKIVFTTSHFKKEFDDKGNIVSKINNKFGVSCKIKELVSIDLDGNGKNEYLALFIDEKSNFFAKCLIDSKYSIISYLTIFKESCANFNGTVDNYDLKNGNEIIDINDDGIMEIIVDMPSYEGNIFKVFTYKNGKFDGDFINNASFQP